MTYKELIKRILDKCNVNDSVRVYLKDKENHDSLLGLDLYIDYSGSLIVEKY